MHVEQLHGAGHMEQLHGVVRVEQLHGAGHVEQALANCRTKDLNKETILHCAKL